MLLDPWLPRGYALPDGSRIGALHFAGPNWQIFGCPGAQKALVALDQLAQRWLELGLIEARQWTVFDLGGRRYWSLSAGPEHRLGPVDAGISPDTKMEAQAFAVALKNTRELALDCPLHDALYVETLSRLLPTFSLTARIDDDLVLGGWLTGGLNISVRSFRRLQQALTWLGPGQIKDIIMSSGLEIGEGEGLGSPAQGKPERRPCQPSRPAVFGLPGRPELASFFNEHVIDLLNHRERYAALGIEFPSAVILHGPPGCGKTFAVERLIEFLGWPDFKINASSVASPYIHETSRKVAQVFDQAMDQAPSVLVIDEMEAFLADREMGVGSSHHRVEEVAEFLRRIPDATQNRVLILAMTNRIEMIDPAVLRRGRFDHVIKVDFASEEEILSLLESMLLNLPKAEDVDPKPLAAKLAGRPLSDVTFVVREGARLAAKSGKDKLAQNDLQEALASAPARDREGEAKTRMGFM